MERYKILIHNDILVNKATGALKSRIGHFYVEFQGENVEPSEAFFGKNPETEGNFYDTAKITNEDEAKRYAASVQHPETSKLTSKEIYLTKEQFDKAYQYAQDQQQHPEQYIGIYNDCIDFTQAVYKAAGQKGHFAQLYTAEELNIFKSAASFSFILQGYHNRDAYKVQLMQEIIKNINVVVAVLDSVIATKMPPNKHVHELVKNGLDILGYKEFKEALKQAPPEQWSDNDRNTILKVLNEEFAANKDAYIEVEVLKKCGNPIFIEKPTIDYIGAFDMSPQVDSSMQILKGCKSDPKNKDPNKLVPYEVVEFKKYYGCGTQLGWYLNFRNFDEACGWAKKYPAQIDKPFIIDRGAGVYKGYFLLSATHIYGQSYQINPKFYTECLDLALQNTASVDVATTSNADNAYPTIFKLITSYSLKQPAIMEKFFAKGINANLPACDKYKCQSALGYAVQNGDEQLAKMLLEHGANPNVGIYDKSTQKHTPPLQMAFTTYNNNKYKLLKTLLEHNADLREGATIEGKTVKSNEDYYQFVDTAYKSNTIDEESYNFFQKKFGYFKAPYDEKYSACKSMVTNEFNAMHINQPIIHDEL